MLSARATRDLAWNNASWTVFRNVDWPGQLFANNGLPPDGEYDDKLALTWRWTKFAAPQQLPPLCVIYCSRGFGHTLCFV